MSVNAQMIAPDAHTDAAPLLRREFSLEEGHGAVRQATLTLSALGVVEAWLNAEPVSADLLTPGWSSYEWRLRYQTYDVTTALAGAAPGVLGLALGNGWYRGRLGWTGSGEFYGTEAAAYARLEIEFADGHLQSVVTDSSWTAGASAVTANDLYDGQDIDARLVDHSWLRPGFDGANWGGVHAVEFDESTLTPYVGPAVRRQEELDVVEVITTPSGATVLDFGQNLVGFLRIRVAGPTGTSLTIRHAEVLENGELGVRPLRTAKATDHFTLSGGDDVFEPTFTLHGFRYAEISGWPGEVDPTAVTAVVVGSELTRIGTFETSEPDLNQFHENVVWGMRGNFVDVPTDCPQRDERLGWTGDIAAFAPTAAFLYDVGPFLGDWLLDVWEEQSHADGIIPFVVPDALKFMPKIEDFPEPDATALWSDAGAWVPWTLYQAYGDDAVLRTQWDSMAAHARRVKSLLSPEGLWDTVFQFGDWLDPDAPPEDAAAAKADKGVVSTACAYRTAIIVADTAALLGKAEDEAEFRAMADDLKAAFHKHYVGDDGIVLSDCTTVYSLAIVFDLLEGALLDAAGDRLSELVAESGFRISTGFAGTPFITDALTDTGHLDDAYRLLLQRECPSWLYPVTMGATTIWERWDSMLPDGSINRGEMTSFNHYALGAVADWMHRVVGGLTATAPGYASVLVAPRPGGGLTSATTALETPHGRISVAWVIEDGELTVTTEVPAGITGVVRLPGADDRPLEVGRRVVSAPFGEKVSA
jgi:alpha-L-rhamnosidase